MRQPKRFGKGLLLLSGCCLLGGTSVLAQGSSNGMPAGGQGQTPSQTMPSQTMPGGAGRMDSMNNTPPGQTSPMDRVFVHKALEGGMAEVALGKLATEKASSQDVKDFGQKMVEDHTKLGDQMKQVAQQIGEKVPDGPSKKDQAEMAKLQALSGDAFDKAYVKAMVKDHEKDVRDFKSEAQNGSNPAVKDAANQAEPTIAQHLEMVKGLAQKNGAMATKGGMN